MNASTAKRKLLVRLIHWNEAEAGERAAELHALGYMVDHSILRGPEGFKEIRDNPPAAVVIDLSRIPSHGREVAIALRSYKDTRYVPIAFVGGDPEKVRKVKTHLPDAAYTDWDNIGGALREALSRPVVSPVVPRSRMEAYAGTPLPKKLGIKPDTLVFLVGAPKDFQKTLGGLPPRVSIDKVRLGDLPVAGKGGKREDRKQRLVLWFVRKQLELTRDVARMAPRTPDGGVWIIWPKKSSRFRSDLSQNIVRAAGLGAGLVDYKICSVDKTWSGLLFARRKKKF